MLRNKLYKVVEQSEEDNKTFIATVKINADHEIFEGHFPGQPVLPGVCLIEMTKELLGEFKKDSFRLKSASNIKYPKLVDPTQDEELKFELKVVTLEESLDVNVTSFLKDGSANFKMKGNFVPAS